MSERGRSVVALAFAGAAAAMLASCERSAAPSPAATALGGISIGMSVDAYRDVTAKPPGFQLAGITGSPGAVFDDGKLQKFTWRFPGEKYLVVRGALTTQFPQLKCEMARGHEVCTANGTLTLVEGQRSGSWTSYVALERRPGS